MIILKNLIIKNNIFTDISNFVMYELGQPTHCYDFKSVKGGLILTKLNEDAHFESLQGQEINLNADEIVFKNTDGQIVNLPGLLAVIIQNVKWIQIQCLLNAPILTLIKLLEKILSTELIQTLHIDLKEA